MEETREEVLTGCLLWTAGLPRARSWNKFLNSQSVWASLLRYFGTQLKATPKKENLYTGINICQAQQDGDASRGDWEDLQGWCLGVSEEAAIDSTSTYLLWTLSYPSSDDATQAVFMKTCGPGKSGGSRDVTSQKTLLQILEATSFQPVPETGCFLLGYTNKLIFRRQDRLLVLTVVLT